MANVVNNALLDSIITYAVSIGDGNGFLLTAEKFLVSVIDVVNGDAPFEVSQEDKEILKEALLKYLPKSENTLEESRKVLIDYIKSGKETDSLFFYNCIRIAQKSTEDAGKNELMPVTLLECINSNSEDFEVKYLGKSPRDDNKNDSDPSSDLVDSLIRKADSLSSKGNSAVNSDQNQPAPQVQTATSPQTKQADGEINNLINNMIDSVSGQGKGQEEKQESDSVPNRFESDDAKKSITDLTLFVKNMQKELMDKVYSQNHAIDVFVNGYFQAELSDMTDKERSRPMATFLFAGPPGVGKTFLASLAAEKIGYASTVFDMSEYSGAGAVHEFAGTDATFANAKSGNFTSYVMEHPKSIVVFDEIEKADISVIHLFLQILDRGFIRDSKTDQEISLKNTILVFTTNAAHELYEGTDSRDFSDMPRKVIIKALENDIDPRTREPYFPKAICSRFASGNVVMFNYVSPSDLLKIATKEVEKQIENFEKKFDVSVELDKKAVSAVVLAEGGFSDARAVKSKASTFFNSELYELCRLLETEDSAGSISKIESIKICLEAPDSENETYKYFYADEKPKAIIFSSEETFKKCTDASSSTQFFHACDVESADKLIKKQDIDYALVDITYGKNDPDCDYLNLADVKSKSRDFIRYVKKTFPDIPVFIIHNESENVKEEEIFSYLSQGAVDAFTLTDDCKLFDEKIIGISDIIHQNDSIMSLARANKVVAFETAQTISDDGKTAEIKLFDFSTNTAIDAEDADSLVQDISRPDVTFGEVIGAEEAKKELLFFVDYLKHPKKYMTIGAKAPKGVLLYGPPGTGKTMLAKAMAHESGVTYISSAANQFLNMFQGVGGDRVRELFRTARKYAPAIIFIDEIDAIAKQRTGMASGDTEETLTALLTEMDGFENNTTKPVFVLAATNFDANPGSPKSLDPALMRRFDRRLYIDLPDKKDRLRYIDLKLKDKPAFNISDEMRNNIAIRSAGKSLADLESIIDLALRTAIKLEQTVVTDEIFEEAFETFNSGDVNERSEDEVLVTARHEAGHALLYWMNGNTPSYVTVVSRGNYGGYMQHDSAENEGKHTKEFILSHIRVSLAGRAAELVYYGSEDGLTAGASADLENATRLAKLMICSLGMDEEFGLAVISEQEASNGAMSIELHKRINTVLKEQLDKAVETISQNKSKVDALVDALLEKDHLTGDEICRIFENN